MPKKKKAAITGYAMFVNETREDYQRKGKSFPRNNQEAFALVAPLWKKLSDDLRQKYNNLAKEEKRKGSNDLETKFNAHGVSLMEIENNRREIEESNDIMANTIINSVKNTEFETTFKTKKFYLCHVNYFYVNSNEVFKPAEIALSEFNLKNGLLARFHAFINPGRIETGYRFEAKRRLEDTHRIPIEDPKWTCAENDYAKLYSQIKEFLCKDNPNGRIPPIYTMPDDEKNNFSLSAVQSTIETLCEACEEEVSEFRIYPLPQLYHELRLKSMLESTTKKVSPAQTNVLTISMALYDLERDKFCYSKGIACEYHEDKDIGNYCSLSIVTRLVYTMSDYLLNFLGEPLIPGGHAPKNSRIVKEIPKKDDGSKLVPLRKPKLPAEENYTSMKGNSSGNGFEPRLRNNPRSENYQSAGPSSQSTSDNSAKYKGSSGFSYASAMRSNSSAPPLSEYDPLPSQLKFQTPRNTQNYQDDDDDDPPSSIYQDSSLATPNLSQNSGMSGYSASASLSQSSDLSIDSTRYLGRGRGGVRLQSADSKPINWAAIASGRGAQIKSSFQPK